MHKLQDYIIFKFFTFSVAGSASVEQKNGNGSAKNNKTNNNGIEVNRNEEQNGSGELKSQAKKKPNAPGSGPLLQQAYVSTSISANIFRLSCSNLQRVVSYINIRIFSVGD